MVHIVDSLEASLAQESLWVLVSQLEGLVDSSGGTGWDGSSEDVSAGGVDISLNCGVSSGVDDLSSSDLLDGREVSN